MPKVSIFKNIAEIYNPNNIDLITYLEQTRDGKWEDIVNECRILKTKEERKAKKATMPTTTLSGTFNVRKDTELNEHSGVIAMDIDEVENLQATKKILERDKYVLSVFMSTSGYGLRALFKIDPAKHREAFKGISFYLFNEYKIICDPNGINPSKPYVVSFDPSLYLNPDIETMPVFKKYVKETAIKQSIEFIHTPSDFNAVVSDILERRINICESYNDWLKLGFALSEEFGEGARSVFHSLSQLSNKYNTKLTDKQYNYCLKARGQGNKVGISTFYYLAKSNGVKIVTEEAKTIIRATKNGKKAGLNKKQIVENLEKFSSITGSEDIVNKVFDDTEIEDTKEQSILYQLEMFLNNGYNLRLNEVTGFFDQDGKVVQEIDLNTIYISAKKLMPTLDYQLMLRLLKSDFIPVYNPFFEFFGSDGIPVILPAIPQKEKAFTSPLIDKLSSCIINENPAYTLYFLRKWLVGIISAAHKVHSPLHLCLLGKQNSGKTEFFRRLLPDGLKQYYAESKLDREKDDEILMCEKLLVMDDEMGGKSKSDSLKLKNLTSKQHFSLRRPYGYHNETLLRLAVLCGTSNYDEVLSDPTGNRRVIPIKVDNINKELYNSIDKKELFMEAFRLYKEGFDWRVMGEDITYLNTDKEEFEIVIKEKELIERYFEPGDEVRLSTTDILVELEKLTTQRLSVGAVSIQLKNLGFEKKATRPTMKNGKKALTSTLRWCVKRVNRENITDEGEYF